MSPARQALLKKFAGLAAPKSSAGRDAGELHRSKGRRHRMTLRLDADLARGLRTLKVALAIDMNTFCEEVLAKVVSEKLIEVKAGCLPGEWDVIIRCAHGNR